MFSYVCQTPAKGEFDPVLPRPPKKPAKDSQPSNSSDNATIVFVAPSTSVAIAAPSATANPPITTAAPTTNAATAASAPSTAVIPPTANPAATGPTTLSAYEEIVQTIQADSKEQLNRISEREADRCKAYARVQQAERVFEKAELGLKIERRILEILNERFCEGEPESKLKDLTEQLKLAEREFGIVKEE